MSKAARSRWCSPALYAGILVAFLLPFATVSCDDEKVTFSGAELALMQVPEDSGENLLAGEIEAESSLPALAALAAALAGFFLGVAGRRGGGIAAAAGSLAMLALVWDYAASVATVDVHAGFLLALLGFAAAATDHALAARRRRAAASDGPAPAAESPLAQGSSRGRSAAAGSLMLLALLGFAGCGVLLDVAGSEAEPEYVGFDTADHDPDWSPDGREIAFARGGAVHAVAPDGSCARRVTDGGEPAWSPDGERLAVTRCGGDACAVVLVSRDGTDERELINGPYSSPAWSRDGTQLYLSRAEDDMTTSTWTVRVDGSGLRRLAPPWVARDDPRWSIGAASELAPTTSPDGARFAFASFDDPTVGVDELQEAIFLREVRGGPRLQLSDPATDAGDYDPAWSPDGRRISFQRSGEIAVMEADGSDERVLTNVDGATSSSWSPDSRELVFTRELYGGSGYFSDPSALMVVDVESRSARELTWGPEPVAPCRSRG